MASIIGATYVIKYHRRPARPSKLIQCYQDRNNRLAEMGMTYHQYLKSKEWREIKCKVLSSKPNCVLCQAKTRIVHHIDYEWDTLLGGCLDSLIPLCDPCHKWIEFKRDNSKVGLRRANSRLMIGLRKLKTPEASALIKTIKARLLKLKRIEYPPGKPKRPQRG